MVEHDEQVGQLLTLLDELGVADNTIVVYTTDNGAECFTWPDGGSTPEFPPRAKAASFTVSDAMEKITTASPHQN
jgi:arylsulfatase A-like enzyme